MRTADGRRGVIAAAALAALALTSGCTGAPPPRPAPSPTACEPADSRVTWEPKQEAEDAPIGYEVHTVAEGGADATGFLEDVEQRVVPYEPTVSADDGENGGDHLGALVDSFERTGQAPDGLRAPRPDFGNVEIEPDRVGTYIVGYWTAQVRAPFTVDCDGGTPWSGELLASEGSENGTVVVQCGYTAPEASGFSDETLAQCPDTEDDTAGGAG